jgi:lipopolysaccharide export system protein LptC
MKNNGRPTNRLRLGVIIALLVTLALGSFWVLEVQRRSISGVLSDLPKDEPDYTVEKFNFVRMAKTGQARYNISGMKLTHFPADDSFEIERPVFNGLAQDQSPMTMRAEKAIVDNAANKIHMYRNVEMDRPKTDTKEHFHLRSEYLLILPDEDIMQTDKPVDITFGVSKLAGTGMFINNATREFRLSSNVRGTFQPSTR